MNNKLFQKVVGGINSIINDINPKTMEKKKVQKAVILKNIESTTALWKSASVEKAKELYVEGKHRELAIILPHLRRSDDFFIKELLSSRLLTLGKIFETAKDENADDDYKTITLGADPEFILEDDKGTIVLFSSELSSGNIVLSEATLGADYGLMEFRPPYEVTPGELIKNIKTLHQRFKEDYTKVFIKETEAVVFNHKMARVRAKMEKEEIDFGINYRKGFIHEADINLDDESTYFNATLSAFNEPLFKPKREDILSAGGHIHVGGTFIRMLSLEQMKRYVRKIDSIVAPLCTSVETPAATVRQELYGAPGEFRIKPYGLEYRTPSNAIFWDKQQNTDVLLKILDIMVNTAKNILLEKP